MKTCIAVLGIAWILVSCAGVSLPKIDAMPPAQGKSAQPAKPKPYPLKTCLVSGEDLDEMDERVSIVYKGQTYEFCCKPCLVKFKKDQQKYASKLRAAAMTP